LLTFFGLWRLCRRPAADPEERRLERFLFCWFAVGMLIFCIAPHQRADLLWPIMPAGALIAGRELHRLGLRIAPRRFYASLTIAVLLGLAGFGVYHFGVQARQPVVRRTVALKQLAQEIESRAGRDLPLVFVDTPMTLQVYLHTLQPSVYTADRRAAARTATRFCGGMRKNCRSRATEVHWHTISRNRTRAVQGARH
jgi:hypothetical protein